jgi:hypothetical protein
MAPRENNLNSLREVHKRCDCTPCRSEIRAGYFAAGLALGLGGRERGLLHAFGSIPPALFTADVYHLASVIRVVRADVRDARRIFLQRGFVACFNKMLEVGQHFVELRDRCRPGFCIEIVEGFVVVAAEFRRLLPFQLRERFRIPENEMIRQLPDRMIAAIVFPRRLLGGKSRDSEAWRHEPVLRLVSRP